MQRFAKLALLLVAAARGHAKDIDEEQLQIQEDTGGRQTRPEARLGPANRTGSARSALRFLPARGPGTELQPACGVVQMQGVPAEGLLHSKEGQDREVPGGRASAGGRERIGAEDPNQEPGDPINGLVAPHHLVGTAIRRQDSRSSTPFRRLCLLSRERAAGPSFQARRERRQLAGSARRHPSDVEDVRRKARQLQGTSRRSR